MYQRVINILRIYWQKYHEFISYCFIGVSGVIIDCLLFTFFTKALGWHYQLANALSVSAGICNNFFLNAFLNFKRTDHLWLRFLSFYGVGLTGLGVSALLLWVFISKMRFPVIPSKIAIVFIVTLLQFSLNKLITFKKKKEASDETL